MARPSHITVAGITFQRSIIGWVGEIHGKPVVVNHHTRGLLRWSVTRLQGGPLSPVYGRAETMTEAVEQAKACKLLQPAPATAEATS